jgi:hypothetical protein
MSTRIRVTTREKNSGCLRFIRITEEDYCVSGMFEDGDREILPDSMNFALPRFDSSFPIPPREFRASYYII